MKVDDSGFYNITQMSLNETCLSISCEPLNYTLKFETINGYINHCGDNCTKVETYGDFSAINL